MKVGDLVKIVQPSAGHGAPFQEGTPGLVTHVSGPSMLFPHEVISIIFSNGETLDDIPARWVEVINEGR